MEILELKFSQAHLELQVVDYLSLNNFKELFLSQKYKNMFPDSQVDNLKSEALAAWKNLDFSVYHKCECTKSSYH